MFKLLNVEQFEHIGAQGEVALIGGEAQLMVRLNGVVALILQRVGADFIQ